MALNAGQVYATLDLRAGPFEKSGAAALNLSIRISDSFRKIELAAESAASKLNSRGKESANTLDGMRSRAERLEKIIGRVDVSSNRFARLSQELARTRSEIEKAEKAASGLGNQLKNTASAGSSLIGALGGAAIGSGIAALSRSILKLGGDMEQTRVSIGVAMQKELRESGQAFEDLAAAAAEASNRFIKDLTEFANQTPSFTAEVIQAGRSLQAFGFHSSTVIDNLKKVGDVAAGANQPLNDIAIIFGKARIEGRLMGDDLLQLVNRNIPVFGEFAKILGVSEGQVRKLGSEGKITFDVLDKAFKNMTSEGGQFFNLMAAQSRTFVGLISTLGGKLQSLGSEIGEIAGNVLKPALEALIGLVDDLSAAWNGLSKETKTAVVIIGGIVIGIGAVIAALPALKIAWSATMAAIASSTAMATAGISLLIGAIVSAGVIIATNRKRFSEFLEPLNNSLFYLAESFEKLYDSVKRALSPIAALFMPIIDAIMNLVGSAAKGKTSMDLLGLAFKPVVVWATAAASWFGFLADAVSAIANVIMGAFRVAWEFLYGGAVQVAGIVGEVIGIFEELYKIFGVVAKAAGDIWKAIVGPSDAASESIKKIGASAEESAGILSMLSDAGNYFAESAASTFERFSGYASIVIDAASSAAGKIRDFFASAFKEISRVYVEFVEPIIGVGKSLSGAFEIVSGVFTRVRDEITDVIDTVIDLAMQNETVRRIVAAIAGAWASITGIVKAVWARVKIIGERLSQFWTQLVDRKSITGAMKALRGDFDDGLRGIQESASRAAKNIGDAISASVKPEDAKKAAEKFATGLRTKKIEEQGGKAGKDFIAEFERGLAGFGRGELTIEGFLKRRFAGMADGIVKAFTGASRAGVGAMSNVLREELEKLSAAGFTQKQIEDLITTGVKGGASAAAKKIDAAAVGKGLESILRDALISMGVTSEKVLSESVGEGMSNGLNAAAKKAGVDADRLAEAVNLERAGKALGLKGKDLGDFISRGLESGMKGAAVIGAKGGADIINSIGAGMASALSNLTGIFDTVKDAAEKLLDGWFKITEAGIKLIQQEIKRFEYFAGLISGITRRQAQEELEEIEKSEKQKIDLFRETESQKTAALRDGFLDRQRMRDSELDQALRAAEEEYRLKAEMELLQFDQDRARIEERAATEERERITEEESAILRKERERDLAEGHQAELERIRQEYAGRELADRNATDAAIEERTRAANDLAAKLEAEKDEKINAVKKKQEEREKQFARQTALIKWTFELAAFEAQKQIEIARLNVNLAQGLMGVARIPIEFGALLGPPGIAIGAALAVGLGQQLLQFYNMSIQAIAASRPLPPAELFMQEGGPVVGPRHSAGGVPVRAEGGEFIMNRRAAANNYDVLSAMNRGDRFTGGDIIIKIDNVVLDPRGQTVDELGFQLGRAVRRYAA